MKLKTQISQAFWWSPGSKDPESAMVGVGTEGARTVSWFDELFKRGVLIPDKDGRPATMLITGPPGSGKSTLALELCYRVAVSEEAPETRQFVKDEPRLSLYISVDATTDQLKKTVRSLGFKDGLLIPITKLLPPMAAVAVWGNEKIQTWTAFAEIVKAALEGTIKRLLGGDSAESVKKIVNLDRWKIGNIPTSLPVITVIDSLNIVGPEEAGMFFQRFLRACKQTRLVVFILESGSPGSAHGFWEYACDVVVRLDNTTCEDYFIRTIEIVKARGQDHVLGKHQMKIYGPARPPECYSHPYRKEGGIFVYPSIHYYLSCYKHLARRQVLDDIATRPESWSELIGGYPRGRCTAFVGPRGVHKSHLGYLHLLYRVINEREVGLLISLRDDDAAAKDTMCKIISQEGLSTSAAILDNMIEQDRLEILYYPPGYITPEEFFHRMYVSVHRLKHKSGGGHITVLFNSLDQLSARFPLCAKQQIFVPGIIECLNGEGITSIFIGVADTPAEQYGLLPMADLILSFQPTTITYRDYCRLVKGPVPSTKGARLHETILLEVVRFARGKKKVGSKGILELVDEPEKYPYLDRKPGLHFTPLSPEISGRLMAPKERWLPGRP